MSTIDRTDAGGRSSSRRHASRRHRCAHGIPRRPATRVLRRPVHVPHPGRDRVDRRRGRRRSSSPGVLGWFAAARRHPVGPGVLLVVVLAVGLAADLLPRLAALDPDRADRAGPGRRRSSRRRRRRRHRSARRPVAVDAAVAPSDAAVAPQPTAVRRRARRDRRVPRHRRLPLRARDGDDHRDGARARTPCASTDFSVRNGPDLFVYLSPDADDYAEARSNSGKLKATDGAFGYELPAGTDPADFASAIIWCKQFSHLFAVAPLAADLTLGTTESRVLASVGEARTIPPENATEGSVARSVARRTLGLLSRLTRENPTGSRRLPRGVSVSCTTTRT